MMSPILCAVSFCVLKSLPGDMEWIRSEIHFNHGKNVCTTFPLVHFDSAESPIVPGNLIEFPELDSCKDLLGCVLWLDAVNLFLPLLCNNLPRRDRILCLGEGTGAVGCGLAAAGLGHSEIYISDLPVLLPLLKLNASLNEKVHAIALDWTSCLESHLVGTFDAVVACEVLYGNRSVWGDLLKTIKNALSPKSPVYICVTLRNARNDLQDFMTLLLQSSEFINVVEIPLSESVSVIRATLG